jgi:dephospho-CoA kinase
MVILGLTGSIGAGKTATAAMFRARGVPVHDADAAVHRLYDVGGAAVKEVAAAFPGVEVGGRIDRERLSAQVVDDAAALRRLEDIVHPLVRNEEAAFLADARARKVRFVVLEIPLLFETGGEKRCDLVVTVSVPPDVQRERVLLRHGMTEEKLAGLLAQQTSDEEKRRRAHFVIETAHGFAAAEKQVDDIMRALAGLPGRPA